MSKLYIAQLTDSQAPSFGLFYDDKDGVRQPHIEDWKHVVFDSLEAAERKLEAIETERAREDNAEPLSLAEAELFAQSHRWKFASTYAKTAQHEYLVKKWLGEEDQLLYERFVQTMKRESVTGYFYGHPNQYLILGDKYYWFMGQHENMAVDLINRTDLEGRLVKFEGE